MANSQSTPPKRYWEGDQMFHVYLCDYLRKRGYAQAALAMGMEAGLAPDLKAPIDAPQGLLFEWWLVLWEILAAKMAMQPDASVLGRPEQGRVPVPLANAATYAPSVHQATGADIPWMPPSTAAAGSSAQLLPDKAENCDAPPLFSPWQSPQSGLAEDGRSTEQSSTAASVHSRSQSPSQSTPGLSQHKGMTSALSPRDLEASQQIGLNRPASSSLIQSCMNMMSFSGKSIEALTPAEKHALQKRVQRLQNAQNQAQMHLAKLHGLQPPKAPASLPSVLSAGPRPSQGPVAPPGATAFEGSSYAPVNSAGQMHKGSPTSATQPVRSDWAAAWPPTHPQSLPAGMGPPLRRLSHPTRPSSPSTSLSHARLATTKPGSQPLSPLDPATDSTFAANGALFPVTQAAGSTAQMPNAFMPPGSAASYGHSPSGPFDMPSGLPFASPGAVSAMTLSGDWPGSVSASQSPMSSQQAQMWANVGALDGTQANSIMPGTSMGFWQPSVDQGYRGRAEEASTPLSTSPAYAHETSWTSAGCPAPDAGMAGQMGGLTGLGGPIVLTGAPTAQWSQPDPRAFALRLGDQA